MRSYKKPSPLKPGSPRASFRLYSEKQLKDKAKRRKKRKKTKR